MTRFFSVVFFTLTVVSPLAGQQPQKSLLVLACTADHASYTRDDTVNLTVTLENRGSSKLYVYGILEWGWTGLSFRFTDAAGHDLPAPWLDVPHSPPWVYEESQLVALTPGYFFGTHIAFDLSRYNLKPGTYYFQVAYRSRYQKKWGAGSALLTSDDGEFFSNKAQIRIDPK